MESNDNTANSAHEFASVLESSSSSKNEVPEWPIAPTFLSLRQGCTEDTANYNTDGIYYTDYLRGFLADLSHDMNIQNALSLFQFVPKDFLPHDPNAENPNEITKDPTKATVIWNDPLDPKITEILDRQGKKIIRIDSGTYVNNGMLCDAFRKCDPKHTSSCFMQDSIVGIFADKELNELPPNSDEYRQKLKDLVAEFNQNRAEISKIKCDTYPEDGETRRLYIHYTCPYSLFEEHIFPIYVQGRVIACLMFGQVARDAFDKKKAFRDFETIMQIYIDFNVEIENVKPVDNELWNKKVDTIINRIETFEKRLENRIEYRNTRYINEGFINIEQQFRKGVRKIRIKGYRAIAEFVEASNTAFNEIREKFDGSDDGFFRMFALPVTTIQKELILIGWSGEISPEERKGYKFSLKQFVGLDNIRDEEDKKKNEIILNGASQQIRDAHDDKDVFWYGTLANNEIAYIVWKRHDQQLHGAAFQRYKAALKNFYSVVLECYSFIRGAKMELLLETTIQQSAHESAHFIVPARDMVENNLRFPSKKNCLDHYSTYKKYFDIEKQSILALLDQLAEINNGSSLIFSEKITINKQPQNVHDLLMNLKRMFSKKSADYDKDIHYVEEKRFVIVNMDVAYFNHALYNLVDNAVKYAFDGSNIYINMDVDRTEGKLKIQFKSFGIQIKEEDREKIYHLFERGEDAALTTKGTGIGMFVVKKVCEAHGGNVWHSSELLSSYNIPVLFNFKYNSNLRNRINLGKMVEYERTYGKEINRLSGLIENEVVHNHNFVKNLITFNSRINTPTYRNIFFFDIPLK